ncbi:hypothetical protein TPHA_0D04580 [Tetrapisispora phaffii CBS 4417]|uniref:Uncharacterized protein n=1 Tax=Tetrapisispora phaffii (strain ATCC 24235 / CBS 4417 / NBRC 1672 / NRRL Y-8282 / UCD 70-5) TaxID=1071381 RepID=G8BS18_TETPH|nr:hypothetical protein TPHA_0D04580 [Tetrapisispora phaffii CBS 4417]CCE63093.1 hypothetical protein TPHA_0D04580 [Tetrapisispora phaffii CBS 4417]
MRNTIMDIRSYTERRSVIEPHYSVLDLLEANMGGPPPSANVISNSTNTQNDWNAIIDLSDSWQILSSSSENSEEEDIEVRNGTLGRSRNANMSIHASTTSAYSHSYFDQSASDTSSSNQFVMPRLSYSKKEGSLKAISVVGSHADSFYQEYLQVSTGEYCFMLDVSTDNSVSLLVVQNHLELLDILRHSRDITVVAIVLSLDHRRGDNLEIIKNCNKVLSSMKERKWPMLYYPNLIIIHERANNNHGSKTKVIANLLQFLREHEPSKLNGSIRSDTVSQERSERMIKELFKPNSAPVNNKKNLSRSSIRAIRNVKSMRKSKYKPRIPLTERDKSGIGKKDDKNQNDKDWFYKWSVSISIGIGIGVGYCLSTIIPSTTFSYLLRDFDSNETNDLIAYMDVVTDTDSDFIKDTIDNGQTINLPQTWDFLTSTVRHICVIMKYIILKPISFLGSNWQNLDDSNRIIAMSYVLL